MYYGEKAVKEMDEYYKINIDVYSKYPYWMQTDCERIQSSFCKRNIMLTLAECKELYSTWSDESHCSSWEDGIELWSKEYIFDLLFPWLKEMLADRAQRILKLTEQMDIK